MEIGGASLGFFDQVGGKIEGGHLRAQGSKPMGGQPVATSNVQNVLARLGSQEGS